MEPDLELDKVPPIKNTETLNGDEEITGEAHPLSEPHCLGCE